MTNVAALQVRMIAAEPRPPEVFLPAMVTVQTTAEWVTADTAVLRSPVPYDRELQTWRERRQTKNATEKANVRILEARIADVNVDIEGGGTHMRGWNWNTGLIGSGKRVTNAVRFAIIAPSGWYAFETMEPVVVVRARLAPLFHAEHAG